MRKPCQHGIKLPKGLRCNHGYLELLLKHKGNIICKVFGQHTKEAQQVAEIALAEKRKDILQGKIGIEPELPSRKFDEVAKLWFAQWAKERNSDGSVKHNEESCYKVKWTITKHLQPFFHNRTWESVTSVDVRRLREHLFNGGCNPITANRYQAILSSMFSHVSDWVKCGIIQPMFKLPVENPCEAVELAPVVRRERILTEYEAKKLKNAFMQLNDSDGWEICKMALKSVLSLKDLKALKIGETIDTTRSKTGVPVQLPIAFLSTLNFFGWRTRWEKARELAGLNDLQFRDLRKTGINWLKGRHELKLISEYAGHANIKTTEKSYTVNQAEKLEPLADDLANQVDAL